MPFNDITGQRFGRLTAIKRVKSKSSQARWFCKCDCGNAKETDGYLLRKGITKSCGCLRNIDKIKHGLRNAPEYKIWAGIKDRCLNSKTPIFRYYGGRGITVCDAWKESFEAFYADMGPRPSDNHSIDRIDNDGPYSPENCRWSGASEQANNKRNNVFINTNGFTLTISQWAKKLGCSRNTIARRLERGWSEKDAVTVPVGHHRKSS